jgi:putative ABC transport system permease protein
VAVLSAATARRYWPGGDPVGRRFRYGDPVSGPLFTVVGVAADARYYGIEGGDVRPMIYFPLSQYGGRSLSLAVRVAPGAEGPVAAALRAEVARADPSLASPDARPLSDALSDTLATRRLQAWALGVFAACALLLAAAGLYGLTSFLVRRRRREIGIRVALGALPQSVAGRLTARGTGLALCGVALGILGGLGAARTMRALLFDVSPSDAPSFGFGAVTMLLVATLANALPAWRASRADPVETLRSE